jgi:hypothetical protein
MYTKLLEQKVDSVFNGMHPLTDFRIRCAPRKQK